MDTDNCGRFVMVVPLKCNRRQAEYLDVLFQEFNNIKNRLIDEKLKALKQMERTKRWNTNQKIISRLYIALLEARKAKDQKAEQKYEKALEPHYKYKDEMLKLYGFSVSQFEKSINEYRKSAMV